jgi:hypothetical protein
MGSTNTAKNRRSGVGSKRRSYLFRLPHSEDILDLDTILEIIDPVTCQPNGKMPLRDLLRKYG